MARLPIDANNHKIVVLHRIPMRLACVFSSFTTLLADDSSQLNNRPIVGGDDFVSFE